MSLGTISSFSKTPSINFEKLNGKKLPILATSIELWFLSQGFHDHLEEHGSSVPPNQIQPWKKTDFQVSSTLAISRAQSFEHSKVVQNI